MTKPLRLQLSRKKGFNLQEHSHAINGLAAVNVARPSKWGNPFAVGVIGPAGMCPIDKEAAVRNFKHMLRHSYLLDITKYPTDFSELRGKNLACWCGPNDFCHVGVLLEKANGGKGLRETITAIRAMDIKWPDDPLGEMRKFEEKD